MNKPDIPPRISEEEEEEQRDDAVIGRAFRGSLAVLAGLAVIVAAVVYWMTRPEAAPPVRETELAPVQVRELAEVQVPTVRFTDVTEEVGINFVHNNGATGQKLLPETMGSGCAAFDFDNDGDQDLLFVNSMDWPGAPPSDRSNTLALYRNDSGTFTDVTENSGLDISIYGMGAAVGDVDNDGLVDVFITTIGKNYLFHNRGEGKFEDITDAADIAGGDDTWSTSAGWFDYDSDGDLDLFVCNYVQWSKEYDLAQDFQLVGGGRAYGRPQNFEGTFPYLYRNDGDLKFTDVSEAAGIEIRNPATGVPLAKSLGLAIADLDDNGTLDLIVANDTVQNLLFRNTGQGTFEEYGVLSGVAFDSLGNARGAMGIDVAAFRNGRALGVAIGNFSNEMTALYVSPPGELRFMDEAISTGLGPNTRLALTFGLFYLDYDLDGRPDLFCANGHLEEDINRVQPSQFYEQPPQLFWNAGTQHATEFVPVTAEQCGEDLVEPMVGRGATYLDYDGDGDLDILITGAGQRPRLLRNDLDGMHHYLRFKLQGDGQRCNRDAIGAWVEVVSGDRVMRKQVMPTRSYLSQVELPLTFGLGDADSVDKVKIHWPDGSVEELAAPAVDQLHEIEFQVSAASQPAS